MDSMKLDTFEKFSQKFNSNSTGETPTWWSPCIALVHWGRKLLEKISPNDITLGTYSKPETDENQDITLGMDNGHMVDTFILFFFIRIY